MYLNTEVKKGIFSKHGKNEQDTGSAEGQVALFTYRINYLTEHLKANKHDHSTRRSLIRLVGKRRSLLDYLKRKDIERYRSIIAELNLRK
jgi:small subunit ribosomal protein S15